MKSHRRVIALLTAGLLGLVACSSNSAGGATETPGTTTSGSGTSASSPSSEASGATSGSQSEASSPATSQSSTAPTTQNKVTLKLYHDKSSWQDFFTKLSSASAQATGVSIDPVPYTDQDAYKAFIRQSFQTSAKPDLFTWWVGGALSDLVSAGVVADTTDLWNQAIAAGYATKAEADYFTVGGKQYCVPLIWSPWVLYYNTKVFKDNGIAAPETWDQLISAADKLKAAGVTPFPDTSGIFSYAMFQLLVSGSDPKLYTGLSDGSVKFTDPGIVAAMNKWADMIKAGYFVAPGGKADFAGDLKNGKIGMEYLGSWFRGNLAAAGLTTDDYTMILPPAVNSANKVIVVEPGPLCSGQDSPNSASATQFLTWMFTPEAQGEWSNLRSDVSFNPKAAIDDPALAALNAKVSSGDFTIANMFYNQMPLPIATEALSQFDAFIADPSNPMTQLDAIQKVADKYWSQHQ